MRKRVVVICPGRGSYIKENLGYLKSFKTNSDIQHFVSEIDGFRSQLQVPTVSELDGAQHFQPGLHTLGEHASALIYACAAADFMSLDRERFEIVAILGNSMGWYISLALGQALDRAAGFKVINTMGSMMAGEIIGGQVIYPLCDESWVPSLERTMGAASALERIQAIPEAEVYDSIYLGGMRIFGANKVGVTALLKELPKVENYPFQLINHAAFHTPLLRSTSERAFHELAQDLFQAPRIPLIDGRGYIWNPMTTTVADLYHYTLGQQVVEPYDFTHSVVVALKEFAPDNLILLGPGSSLGASLGQILISSGWKSIASKQQFTEMQTDQPFVLAMGRPEQRKLVLANPG